MNLNIVNIVSWVVTGLTVSITIYLTKEPCLGWAMVAPAIVNIVSILNE